MRSHLSRLSKMNSAHPPRVIAAGMIGNVLEWYDFAIYGYFAAQIGRHFFRTRMRSRVRILSPAPTHQLSSPERWVTDRT
jgi:hypothetical protein